MLNSDVYTDIIPKFGDHIIRVAGLGVLGDFSLFFWNHLMWVVNFFIIIYIYIEHQLSKLVFWSYSSSFCFLGFSLLEPNRLYKVLNDCWLFFVEVLSGSAIEILKFRISFVAILIFSESKNLQLGKKEIQMDLA